MEKDETVRSVDEKDEQSELREKLRIVPSCDPRALCPLRSPVKRNAPVAHTSRPIRMPFL